MATSVIDKFTASGNWTCPAGVSGIIATLIGAGSGAHGITSFRVNSPPNNCAAVGGAGGGEMLDSVPMHVVPGNIYPVVVGIGSNGTTDDATPAAAGSTTFNGKVALGAPATVLANPPFPFREHSSGPGGGWGGAPGLFGFGSNASPPLNPPGTNVNAHTGQRLHGWRESISGTGGCRGGCGTATGESSNSSTFLDNSTIPMGGCTGGTHTYTGTPNPYTSGTHGYEEYGGGGGGGGTYYGALNGCNYTVFSQDADPDQYGSGAPGPGKQANRDYPIPPVAGKGADGVVLIMYTI